MPRTIAIGDIHGCSQALAALIKAIEPTKDDILVALGDFIDYGPDSRGVLDQLIALQERCQVIPLFGNHEEMLMSAIYETGALQGWLACGGRATLDSYGSLSAIPNDHAKFLLLCRMYHETDTHIFVHANYLPNVPMEKQPDGYTRWEFIDPANPPAPHYSGRTVIVGHTPQRTGEILDVGHLVCIDTSCTGGKWLTAFDVNTKQVWQANKYGRLRR